jgi:hypothetical protein
MSSSAANPVTTARKRDANFRERCRTEPWRAWQTIVRMRRLSFKAWDAGDPRAERIWRDAERMRQIFAQVREPHRPVRELYGSVYNRFALSARRPQCARPRERRARRRVGDVSSRAGPDDEPGPAAGPGWRWAHQSFEKCPECGKPLVWSAGRLVCPRVGCGGRS